jgi:hypothetical protein
MLHILPALFICVFPAIVAETDDCLLQTVNLLLLIVTSHSFLCEVRNESCMCYVVLINFSLQMY